MLAAHNLVNWFRTVIRRPPGRRYTGSELLPFIAPTTRPPAAEPGEAERIRQTFAKLPLLVAEQRLVRRHAAFARYFEHLPRIMFLYSLGRTPSEIAASLDFMATDYGVSATIDMAAQLVADRLNAA